MTYDKIIIGAGLYGLYAALRCGGRGENILVLEYDDLPFQRATYINQARVHMGYHYPRSISTAKKSQHYFERFNEDYGFSIRNKFEKIYATSSRFSWTNADQFKKFCIASDIDCAEVSPSNYFKSDMCDGAFSTTEYTYDAQILKTWFLEQISKLSNIKILFKSRIKQIENDGTFYNIKTQIENHRTKFMLNATYASINQIHEIAGFKSLEIKYELSEVILCKPNKNLKNIGITVMDGTFFSIMPFGKTEYHSLTSVTYTPHSTSNHSLPTFTCQEKTNGQCSPTSLSNCNTCIAKPKTAWPYMNNLAKKYLKSTFEFDYVKSLYSMKPILKASEIDDSRPTVIRTCTNSPKFISVLSGKINTVYELDQELDQ